ncbi:hypothetical protein H5410_062395 [Solanum commersonii]|uniref:Uncharacterized protein n=1 Tax=Solanum commersonii TaxID=4109 RepID=A0A9J5WAQ9_SOLCO|nr:hypothetical protein H5410_062395 [Solanum commersonii]
MDWPEFLESSNPQGPTIDLYVVSPQDNYEVLNFFPEFIASKLPHKSSEEMKNLYMNLFKKVEMEDFLKNKNVVVGDVVDDHHQQHHQVPQEDNSSDKETNLNDTPS